MFRPLVAIGMLVAATGLSGAWLQADDPPPAKTTQPKAAKAVEAPQVAERWYKAGYVGHLSGYLHVTKEKGKALDAQIVFTHEFVDAQEGRRISFTIKVLCRDTPYFTPVRLVSTGGEVPYTASSQWRPDKTGELNVRFADGSGSDSPLTENTAASFVVFDVVQRLPFERGATFAFHSLDELEPNVDKNCRISYRGTEKTTLEGKHLQLHRFEQTGGNMKPVQYWVNDKHELVRVLADGTKEFLLTDEAGAKALLGSALGKKEEAKFKDAPVEMKEVVKTFMEVLFLKRNAKVAASMCITPLLMDDELVEKDIEAMFKEMLKAIPDKDPFKVTKIEQLMSPMAILHPDLPQMLKTDDVILRVHREIDAVAPEGARPYVYVAIRKIAKGWKIAGLI